MVDHFDINLFLLIILKYFLLQMEPPPPEPNCQPENKFR